MLEKIREHLSEVIKMADECPEKYQVKCFEVLLEALLRGDSRNRSLAWTGGPKEAPG